MQLEDSGVLKILKADTGYKLYSVITNNYYDQVYLGKYDSIKNYREIQVELLEEKSTIVTLEDLKKARIQLSKNNLENYLAENPLFSKVKYTDGRYYSVTLTKQQQLTNKLMMYQGYSQKDLAYELNWNDTGNVCEIWEYDQLFTLASEIDNYVAPLVLIQQNMELYIRQATTTEEVEKIDVNYSTENIELYINKI